MHSRRIDSVAYRASCNGGALNNTKFYRYNADGSVQLAIVKVPQPSLATRRAHTKTMNLRLVENAMCSNGWQPRKLKPTQRRPMGEAVLSALRQYALS